MGLGSPTTLIVKPTRSGWPWLSAELAGRRLPRCLRGRPGRLRRQHRHV